jgi:hypothetical protein
MKVKRIPGITIEVESTEGLSAQEVILDQNYYPWHIRKLDHGSGVIRIEPARSDTPPDDPREIYLYEGAARRARFARLVEYMAHIEALDLEIMEVQLGRDTALEIPEGVKIPTQEHGTVNPEFVVLVTRYGDSKGTRIQWGPLPLYALTTPSRWPFKAILRSSKRDVCIDISPGGFDVHDDAFHTYCKTIHDALALAGTVIESGWENALRTFSKEVRIGFFDEFQVRG